MSTFPLFDTLLKEVGVKKRDITVKQKAELIEKVDNINDENSYEYIYMLIRMYHIHETGDGICEIPYGGVAIRKNIKFDLDKMPVTLKHILYKFVCIYNKDK